MLCRLCIFPVWLAMWGAAADFIMVISVLYQVDRNCPVCIIVWVLFFSMFSSNPECDLTPSTLGLGWAELKAGTRGPSATSKGALSLSGVSHQLPSWIWNQCCPPRPFPTPMYHVCDSFWVCYACLGLLSTGVVMYNRMVGFSTLKMLWLLSGIAALWFIYFLLKNKYIFTALVSAGEGTLNSIIDWERPCRQSCLSYWMTRPDFTAEGPYFNVGPTYFRSERRQMSVPSSPAGILISVSVTTNTHTSTAVWCVTNGMCL